MLRIEHFTKSYAKGKPAVEDLNLHVAPGISPTTRTCTST